MGSGRTNSEYYCVLPSAPPVSPDTSPRTPTKMSHLDYRNHSSACAKASPVRTVELKRSSELFENEAGSDVIFMVGVDSGSERWRFPGHRHILAAKSPVFRAMFEGPLATSQPVQEIIDITPKAFENLLRFLYTEDVSYHSIQSWLELHYAAEKYMVNDLVAICVAFLQENLSHRNVLQIYQHMVLFCPQGEGIALKSDFPSTPYLELLEQCLCVIDSHAELVLASEDFENLDSITIRRLVSRDTLQVNSELTVFRALVRWATQECKRQQLEMTPLNKRQVLGDALYEVRFLLLGFEELHGEPVRSGILPEDEGAALLAALQGHDRPCLPSHLLERRTTLERRRGQWPENPYGFPDFTDCSSDTSVLVEPCDKKKKKKKKKKEKNHKCTSRISDIMIECLVCFSWICD